MAGSGIANIPIQNLPNKEEVLMKHIQRGYIFVLDLLSEPVPKQVTGSGSWAVGYRRKGRFV